MNLKRLFLLFILSLSCETEKKKFIEYESTVLDDLVGRVPVQYFDIEEKLVTEIKPDSVIGIFGKVKVEASNYFLRKPEGVIVVGDTLYIADSQANNIKAIDKKGFIRRTIGRKGKGPGEFNYPKEITRNKDKIFVSDAGNSAIHIFDLNMNYIDYMPFKSLTLDQSFDVNDSLLFIPTLLGKDSLLMKVVPLDNDSSPVYKFMPRLTQYGIQPEIYNSVIISANNDLIVTAYYGLPFIFIFTKELHHINTLYLTSERIRSLENPKLGIEKGSSGNSDKNNRGGIIGSMRGMVTAVFNSVYLSSDNILFIVDGTELVILKPDKSMKYNYSSRVKLLYPHDAQNKKDPHGINVSDIFKVSDYIYVSSPHEKYIYRFSDIDLIHSN